jgi:cell wall-associated NlpC family hydrolase
VSVSTVTGEGDTRDVASHSFGRVVRSTGAVVALALAAICTLVAVPASADPLPTTKDDAVRQLADLNHQAEQLTEAWHGAQDQLNARRGELDKAHTDLDTANRSLQDAKVKEGDFQTKVNQLASASFEGARFNQLSALLVSNSPQNFLDQMTALEMLAGDNKQAMDGLSATLQQAANAQQNATDAQARAQDATTQAQKLQDQLGQRKADMDSQIAQVKQRLAQLSPAQKAAYTTQGSTTPPVNAPPASGLAGAALHSAMTRLGDAYVWGAEGPSTFDCSGLVYWAYLQNGYTMPRSSSAQAGAGVAVSKSDIQPGDLLFFYSPISHVGIAVGNGQMIHAPQSGDVVKVASYAYFPLTAVRRITG